MPTDTTIIDLQYEFKIKVETPKEFNNSLFKNTFKVAFKKLNETLIHNITIEQNPLDSYNNIICFTGERGRGKTSTMVSFQKALTENKKELNTFLDEEVFNYHSEENNKNIIAEKKIISLPIIDPSLFKGKESLLEIVVAQMFLIFKNKIEDKNYNDDTNLKKKVIKSFQKFYQKIQAIQGQNTKSDALDALIALSEGSNIREEFSILLNNFLDFFDSSDYLIIAIDDLDFKIEQNYSMLEDIRQVLINNKTIILTTFKYDQLFESINNYFKNQLKNITNNLSEERTQLYLNKIFPLSRCIEIDDLNQLFVNYSNLIIKNGKKILYQSNDEYLKLSATRKDGRMLIKNNFYIEQINYENILRKTLYNKAGIILPIKENRINTVIPKTIRQLLEFFKSLDSNQNSLQDLSNYLFHLVSNDKEKEHLLKLKNCSKDYFKLTFISIIKAIIDINQVDNKQFNIDKIQLIFKATNENNISIGDISSLLILLDNNQSRESNILFKDILEFYFYLQIKIRNIQFYSPELYNGVVKLKTENDWSIIYKKEGFEGVNSIFYHYYGNYEKVKNYREEVKSPFDRKLSKTTKFAVYTPLSFLGNIIFEHLFTNYNSSKKKQKSYNTDLIYDPIIIKQFLNNYIKNINDDNSAVEYLRDNNKEYHINDYKSELYYNCTTRAFISLSETLKEFGIPMLDMEEIVKDYPINWFMDNFNAIENPKELKIYELEILKNRIHHHFDNTRSVFREEKVTEIKKKQSVRQLILLLKKLYDFFNNNISQGNQNVDKLYVIISNFDEQLSRIDLDYLEHEIWQIIEELQQYLKYE